MYLYEHVAKEIDIDRNRDRERQIEWEMGEGERNCFAFYEIDAVGVYFYSTSYYLLYNIEFTTNNCNIFYMILNR